MHRDLMSQRVELFRAGDKVRLAVKFKKNGKLRVAVNIGEHLALSRGALSLLGRLGESLLTKVIAGLLHIA